MDGSTDAASSQQQPLSAFPSLAADEQQPVAGPSRPAKTRSRTGCLTCRRRKHKCGEERLGPASRPTCERCRAAGLDCVWPTADQLPKGRAPRPYRPKTPGRAKRPAASVGLDTGDVMIGGPDRQPSGLLQAGQPAPSPFLSSGPAAAPGPGTSSRDGATAMAAAVPTFLPDPAFDSNSTALWSLNATAGPSTHADAFADDGRSHAGTEAHAPAPDLFDQACVWDLGELGELPLPTAFDAFAFGSGSGTLASIPRSSHAQPPPPASPGSAWLFDLPPSPLLLLNSPLLQSASGSGLSQPLSRDAPSDDDQLALWHNAGGQRRSSERHDDWRGAAGLPRYVTPTPLLEVLFKNPEERSLIQHFLFQIPVVFIGRPQSARGTLAVPSAVIAGNEQLDMRSMMPYLDIGQFLALPRGASTAGDALSMAIMSVAAGHLSHLHHTSARQALVAGDEAAAARSTASEKRYCAVGRSMSRASLSLARSSLDLAQLSLPSGVDVDGDVQERSDEDAVTHIEDMTRLLVACSFNVLTDCISGGHEYEAGLALAKEVIAGSGGARRMLSTLAVSITPATSQASPLAATRRRRLRLLRSVLEELTSWDLVTSLTTGTAPTAFAAAPPSLIAIAPAVVTADDGSVPKESLSDWLFSFSPPSGSHDMSGIDWETVETSWGTSRAVMELFARVNALCSAARTTPALHLEETTAAASRALVEIGVRKADILRSYPELSRSPFPPFHAPTVFEEDEEYRRRVRFGKLGPQDGAGSFVDERRARRLTFGDLLWCMTFELMLRTDVLGEDPASPTLQALAKRVIDLVIESHARKQVQVGLAWPTVIAGSTLRDPTSRFRVRTALSSFQIYTLFELDHATRLLDEIWALRDAGDERTMWRDIAGRNGGFALV